MSQVHFAKMPSISIPRTKMKIPFTHKLTFNFGKIIPILCKEVLPGDTFSVDFAGLIRMSTPIAPIMDNIRGSAHAFFVPMRLLWDHTEEFYGANKTSAGPQLTPYTIPCVGYNESNLEAAALGSVSDYLGKPIYSGVDFGNGARVSVLKERAYWLIVNEWYRAQQVTNPIIIDKGDNGDIATTVINGVSTTIDMSTLPADVCKQFDYFTACTISPQYGVAVTLPLGSYAPVGLLNNDSTTATITSFAYKFTDNGSTLPPSGTNFKQVEAGATGVTKLPTWVADLSNATAATINTLRYAFQVQKYLERSNFGSRFFEMLNAHYGVTSPDARLQRPEHLGEYKFNINIQQVLSTAGADISSNQKLGIPGANSTTAIKGSLFRKGFVEPGYLMVLLSTYQDHTYCQGILREDLRQSRMEFYSPEFANLGDQPVYKDELLVADNQMGQVFGYQEHWAEYRYMPDQVSGLLRPNVSGSLDYWTLADNFATTPTLSDAFIKENRNNIARALVTGSSGPDFVADFYFDIVAVRPMPAYTIPGLIDHFG